MIVRLLLLMMHIRRLLLLESRLIVLVLHTLVPLVRLWLLLLWIYWIITTLHHSVMMIHFLRVAVIIIAIRHLADRFIHSIIRSISFRFGVYIIARRIIWMLLHAEFL